MKALILGHRGQDGTLLAEHLMRAGHEVVGVSRDGPIDICDARAVADFVGAERPDHVYHLAAFHHAAEEAPGGSGALFVRSYETHVLSLVHFLEAIRAVSPSTRLFYAASSLIFGRPEAPVQDERSPIAPDSVYGITKAAGLLTCRHYRHEHGLFAAAGILYNHESWLRAPSFVSRKIVVAAVAIAAGRRREKLVVGELAAATDWGFAPDFVDAFQRILDAPRPDDFIVATGSAHTVRDFVAAAFAAVGLDWRNHVEERPGLLVRKPAARVGDARRLGEVTGWRPRVSFEEMVRLLVERELVSGGKSDSRS